MKDATLRQGKKVWDLIDESGADSQQLQNILPYFAILLKANTAEMNREEFTKACKLKLLELLDTVLIPASSEEFVAKDNFIINTSDDALVKISGLGERFQKEFLGKVKKPFTGSELRCMKLKEDSKNKHIVEELSSKAAIALYEVFFLMKKQGKGQRGKLSLDVLNKFYVPNINGVLRTVLVYWHNSGWRVNAISVESSCSRVDGDQVFSRNS